MKTRRLRLNAQSPNKPKLLAEKGGRIFERIRYSYDQSEELVSLGNKLVIASALLQYCTG